MRLIEKKNIKAVDMFAGAGGTSTGLLEALEALGYEVELTAINHWERAIETHLTNHPGHDHFCNGIDDLDPRKLFPKGFDILWASPECTHHSRARGGKPMQDQSRATAWCVTRWADAGRPTHIFVENVPEFLEWGPLGKDDKPIKERKGETFQAWVNVLRSFGYTVDWKVVTCADHGDPTTRKRLFVQARLDFEERNPIWPAARFNEKGEGLPRWKSARDIIDFDYPSKSIYDRKRPLVANTMKRIFTGLFRHSFQDFTVPNFGEREGQAPRTHDNDKPVPSVTSHGAGCLVQPFVVAIDQQSSLGVWNSDNPLSTVTTKARHCVVEPKLSPYIVELVNNCTAKHMDKPISTVRTSGGHHAYVEPMLLPQHSCGIARNLDQPVSTVATAGAISLVIPNLEELDIDEHNLEPFLISYYGNSQSHPVQSPVNTVTCKERFGLVQPILKIDGKFYKLDIHFRMLQPHELAAAQGFKEDYEFCGNKTEIIKQIGNAVPRNTARALVLAGVSGEQNITKYIK